MQISGQDNCWAALISRWGATLSTEAVSISSGRIASLFTALLAPDLDRDFTWPSPDEISRVQQYALEQETPPSDTTSRNGLLINANGAVWIPYSTQGQFIQLRNCVVGHCSRGGHRGGDITLENVKKYLFWPNIRADVYTSVNSCLHCLATTGGLRISRPWPTLPIQGDLLSCCILTSFSWGRAIRASSTDSSSKTIHRRSHALNRVPPPMQNTPLPIFSVSSLFQGSS